MCFPRIARDAAEDIAAIGMQMHTARAANSFSGRCGKLSARGVSGTSRRPIGGVSRFPAALFIRISVVLPRPGHRHVLPISRSAFRQRQSIKNTNSDTTWSVTPQKAPFDDAAGRGPADTRVLGRFGQLAFGMRRRKLQCLGVGRNQSQVAMCGLYTGFSDLVRAGWASPPTAIGQPAARRRR